MADVWSQEHAVGVLSGWRYTSREAISRFVAEQNRDEPPTPALTATQRQRQAETANRLLQEAGV